MGWNYSDKLVTMFQDALSGSGESYHGRIANADGIGHHGSIACGDAIVFSFKVERADDPKMDRIASARYETFGCTSAIASSEALCYIIESMKPTPVEALSITAEDIAVFLEGMPKQKMHCSVMGAEVLKEAVKDWAIKRNVDHSQFIEEDKHAEDEGPLVCTCFNRTDAYLRQSITDLAITSLDELMVRTQAGTGCGSCINTSGGLHDILKEETLKNRTKVKPITAHDEKENQEIEAKVTLVIQTAIRPHLNRQGSDIQLVRVKGNLVYCELSGDHGPELSAIIDNLFKELVHPELRLVDF
ncbi:MAG: iron-sulfur cluster assembly scaffold protein [Bacteriovoracaceae bacterium]|nr:iron-sulfur cluster assembly scaffold protein [Bacteriovoracaceae bacterium]